MTITAAPDDAGAFHPTSDPQHQDDLEQPLSHNGHDGQQQQQPREGHPGIDKALRSQVQFLAQSSLQCRRSAPATKTWSVVAARPTNIEIRAPMDQAAHEVPPPDDRCPGGNRPDGLVSLSAKWISPGIIWSHHTGKNAD